MAISTSSRSSDRAGTRLTRADAHHMLERGYENLSVADAPGVGHLSDGFYHAVELVILESRLQSGTSAENRRR
jgi:hypothetical protein